MHAVKGFNAGFPGGERMSTEQTSLRSTRSAGSRLDPAQNNLASFLCPFVRAELRPLQSPINPPPSRFASRRKTERIGEANRKTDDNAFTLLSRALWAVPSLHGLAGPAARISRCDQSPTARAH